MDDKLITIPFKSNSFPAYSVRPNGDIKGGLIIIHEVWALNEHTKDIARRFAEQGYYTLAPDLLSGTALEGGLDPGLIERSQQPDKYADAQKELRERMAPIQAPEFGARTLEKLKLCFNQLYDNPDTHQKVAVVGYCFGGTYSFMLAASEPRLKAAVPYYGHTELSDDQIQSIKCPILAFYGEQDSRLTDELPELEKRMKNFSKDFTYKIYPGTGHAFFNDTNLNRYNKEAADDAWKLTLQFLSEHL